MNHLLAVVLVLCAFSVVLCHTAEDSADFTRCKRPAFPQECHVYGKVYQETRRSMMHNKEIGSCPEPKSCEDCKEDDVKKVISRIEETTARCKAYYNDHVARNRSPTTTPQP